jgi:hypothetical protein
MPTQVQVVYPTTTSFSGSAQLNEGPFLVPTVNTFLRVEVRGKINFAGVAISPTGIENNWQLWGVQWVPHGSPANDVVTTADGPQWFIREQVGSEESRVVWAPSTDVPAYMAGYPLKAEWAGQQQINQSIDLYLSLRAPTGVSIPTMDLYASLRLWWS